MSTTLRRRSERFTKVGQLSNDVINLKFKSKSRLKHYQILTPLIPLSGSVNIAADLGSAILIKDVFSSDFGVSIELHSTPEFADEDALIYDLDPSDHASNQKVRIINNIHKNNPIVTNRDNPESQTIYLKIINTSYVGKKFLLEFIYYDISENVYDFKFPEIITTSGLLPVIVPKIVTPIPNFEVFRYLNEFSTDIIPRLLDPIDYSSYNTDDHTNVYRNSGVLISPTYIKDLKFIKKLQLSHQFNVDGQYKIYLRSLAGSDELYPKLLKYGIDPNFMPSEGTVKVVIRDQTSSYTHELTVNTSNTEDVYSSKMLTFNIKNSRIQSNPILTDID